jgi:hypothetical protein
MPDAAFPFNFVAPYAVSAPGTDLELWFKEDLVLAVVMKERR